MGYLKRVLSILTAFLCYMAAAAQTPQMSDMDYPSGRKERFLDLKLHFSIGGSTSVNNYKSVLPGLRDMQFSPGVLFRPGVEVNFKINKSLAVGTGLELGINNTRCALSLVDENTSSINSIYLKNHFYNINVPVFMAFKLDLGRRIKSLVDVGVYFAYGIGGNTHASGYTSGQNALGQPLIYHLFYKRDYYDDSNAVINSVRRLDYGPRLSVGLLYSGHYSFNWVFQMSARNLAMNQNVLDVKYRHLTLGFEVGYIF